MKTSEQILEDVREADCPPGGRARAERVISEAMSAAEAKGRRGGLEEAARVVCMNATRNDIAAGIRALLDDAGKGPTVRHEAEGHEDRIGSLECAIEELRRDSLGRDEETMRLLRQVATANERAANLSELVADSNAIKAQMDAMRRVVDTARTYIYGNQTGQTATDRKRKLRAALRAYDAALKAVQT